MAPQKSLTALLLAGAAALGGAHDIAPNADPDRYVRHAKILSESCQAKHGRELLVSARAAECQGVSKYRVSTQKHIRIEHPSKAVTRYDYGFVFSI